MTNQTYDRIKLAALLIVPFLAFLASVCTIIGFSGADKAVAILAALDTLIGAWVKMLSDNYHKELAE